MSQVSLFCSVLFITREVFTLVSAYLFVCCAPEDLYYVLWNPHLSLYGRKLFFSCNLLKFLRYLLWVGLGLGKVRTCFVLHTIGKMSLD